MASLTKTVSIISFSLIILTSVLETTSNSICHPDHCYGDGDRTQFSKMCSTDAGHLEGRCCYNINKTLIGLDWSGCDVENFTATDNMKTLKFLLVYGPKVTVCLANDTLRGFVDLEYVEVNSDCNCPGGQQAWLDFDVTENSTLTCENQRSACGIDSFGCPLDSYCADDGPGMTACLCNSTFTGYKCLRQGTFPTTTFLIGWLSSTLVSGVVCYILRSYHIRKGRQINALLHND